MVREPKKGRRWSMREVTKSMPLSMRGEKEKSERRLIKKTLHGQIGTEICLYDRHKKKRLLERRGNPGHIRREGTFFRPKRRGEINMLFGI